jgi:hypothetical protein
MPPEHFKRPNSGFEQDPFPTTTRAAGCFAQSQLCLSEENYVTTAHLSLPSMVHEMNLLELPDRVDHLKRQQSWYPQMVWRKADAMAAHGKSGSFVGSECHLPWFS